MRGLEIFRKHFISFENCYVVIGGTACTILLDKAGGEFRATKDVDMVLIVENINEVFAKKFWEFIKDGQYRKNYSSQGKANFYRFEDPENDLYPAMIELFTRSPANLSIVLGSHLLPLHLADDISSLSAILLNDDYYNFLLEGKKVVDGMSILDEYHLIPFKAKAWCELTDRQNEGEIGLSKHIKKHKKDIANLLTLVIANKTVELKGIVLVDMIRFEKEMRKEELTEKTTGIKNMTIELYCSQLRTIYCL